MPWNCKPVYNAGREMNPNSYFSNVSLHNSGKKLFSGITARLENFNFRTSTFLYHYISTIVVPSHKSLPIFCGMLRSRITLAPSRIFLQSALSMNQRLNIPSQSRTRSARTMRHMFNTGSFNC